jgi:capsular polysaccharide biosynthesis protein
VLSSNIANSLGDQGVRRVKEIMNVSQMSVYEYSEVSMIPSNDVSWQIPVLLGIVAAILVYGICLIIMIFDDKINDTDDAENYLGLTVLGDIPHLLDDMKKRGQNRYYGKYYGKYVGKSGDK